MGVIAKLFINNRSEHAGGTATYTGGAVCRGEVNKDWSAATPSASFSFSPTDLLDELWAGPNPREFHATIAPDPEGNWVMGSCDFTYGGCQVKLREVGTQPGHYPSGKFEMNVNAQAATKSLRQAYADGLLAGVEPKFRLVLSPVD